MKKFVCLYVIVLLTAAVFVLISGCAKKETVIESSSSSQNEAKQEAVTPPKPETVNPAVVEEQKVVSAQTIEKLADIHFDFDEDILRPEDRVILNGHANWLLKNTEYKVRIEGNCDERGTEEYNLALGQRRADTAKQYLTDMGVDGKRITTVTYGKERPVDPAHNEEAWVKNRNDHFVLNK